MAKGATLPDKGRLLRKAKSAKKLLDEGRLGSQKLTELLGEVATDAELRAKAWASTSYNHWQALADTAERLESTLKWANKPENLLHAQIPEYIGAVDDAANSRG